QTYLGYLMVSTDASGAASFDSALPVQPTPGLVISATATSASGDTSELSGDLAIASAPVANAGQGQSGPEGTALTFAGSVTGGAAPRTSAGRSAAGGSASARRPRPHAYQDAGTYTVTLTVTDAQGRSSSSSATATVSEVTPTASAGGPYSGGPGTAINFTGSA